ncbi:MoxR protein [Pandoraea commovens]|uniref:DUF58 domain-containing protein n=2 Tax=Pandoraea commovens TaxID=2508289 RepID=A0A5E4RH72_9BURK|nr:DUF58 domain-containing protein [Pandoraea commovens]UVA81863.1 DUF58 domain-containing protein [Pandoraea commovens]VVD61882.1 MoxR protein [Pandoraea commovens]
MPASPPLPARRREVPADTLGTVHVDVPHLMRLRFRVHGLSFVAPAPVRSVLSGNHTSRLRGRGLNFDEIRGYVPGDDIRHIDWRASMRVARPLVRAYTEERDRPVQVVVDQRMSMHFGSQRAFKSVVAAETAALATWMGYAAGDRVGGVVFNDARIERVRPLRSLSRIARLFGAIAEMNAELHADSPVRTDYAQLNQALGQLLHMAPHDHLICIVSDFAGADTRTQALLRQLSVHNDVVAGLVFDPLWQHVDERSALVVSEGHLQVELRVANERVRTPVAAFFRGRTAEVAELLRTSGVPWMPLSSAEAAVDQVRRLLGARHSGTHGGGL